MRPVCTLFLLILSLTLLSDAVGAQEDCTIGAYPTPDGVLDRDFFWSYQRVPQGYIWELTVYYVIHVEDFVRGVAWNRRVEAPGNLELLASVQHYDPLEQFLEVTDNGFRMGLGDCQSGFGGSPILVLEETLVFEESFSKARSPWQSPAVWIILEPNALEDPQHGVYADCSDAANKHLCTLQDSVWTVEVGSPQSWGSIKASYR